jgi:ribosome-associated protein
MRREWSLPEKVWCNSAVILPLHFLGRKSALAAHQPISRLALVMPAPGHSVPPEGLVVNDSLTIPRSELEFRASRSSGAGGQHVNKTSSRVEIEWNVASSPSLSASDSSRIQSRLASRISAEGTIRVAASDTRSQLRNREIAESRLAELIAKALVVQKKRKPTKRPRAANEARLTEKKKHSDKKRQRRIAE